MLFDATTHLSLEVTLRTRMPNDVNVVNVLFVSLDAASLLSFVRTLRDVAEVICYIYVVDHCFVSFYVTGCLCFVGAVVFPAVEIGYPDIVSLRKLIEGEWGREWRC